MNKPATITPEQIAARRVAMGLPSQSNQVAWRKKGCATCKPIVVDTRPAAQPASP